MVPGAERVKGGMHMEAEQLTIINRITVFFADKIYDIEYFFAKRWLDKTFGEQEYWGDYISELIQRHDSPKARNNI